MTSIWVESLGRSFDQALDLLVAAVRDCTDQLWVASMWEVPARDPEGDLMGPDGKLITDPAERRALAQRWSTPWSVAWHALECLDYDLTGSFGPWAPPPPFTGHPHWRDLTSLPSVWPRSELLAYVDYCRRKVRDTLGGMTEETAATLLPPTHRYGGQPHAWIITGLVVHTTEHASQIQQFITASGITPGE
jgi:hypothetical protein